MDEKIRKYLKPSQKSKSFGRMGRTSLARSPRSTTMGRAGLARRWAGAARSGCPSSRAPLSFCRCTAFYSLRNTTSRSVNTMSAETTN